MNGIVLLYFNEKGGVGKTTLSALTGYIFDHENKKCLEIDLDPQHNLTDVLSETYQNGKPFNPTINLRNGLTNEDLSPCICHADKNVDVIQSNISLIDWQREVDRIKRPDRFNILNQLLRPLKSDYDYIIVDVPPTFNAFSMNAIFAADGISLVLQTEKSSYTSALDTVQMLGTLKQSYGIHFKFLGAILYLMIRASTTKKIKNEAKHTFKGFLFNNVIRYHERINRFTDSGIKDKDYWDKKAIGMYNQLVNELQNKVKGDIINA